MTKLVFATLAQCNGERVPERSEAERGGGGKLSPLPVSLSLNHPLPTLWGEGRAPRVMHE